MTGYIVLKQKTAHPPSGNTGSSTPDVGAGGWFQVGPPVDAVSAEAAVRKAVDGDIGGIYVAVPVRSWSPITVTVETQRKLTLA